MKPFFSFFLLCCFISTTYASDALLVSDACLYKREFTTCIQANKNWQSRSVSDFVCLASNNYYKIMGQIILDTEFKKLDAEVTQYFENLQRNKNYYFWTTAQEPFTNAIDMIEDKFDIYGEYGQRYMSVCSSSGTGGVVQRTIACFNGAIPQNNAWEYFFEESTCRALVALKLEVNKQVAYDVLKLNKSQIAQDEDKRYMQIERNKYDMLLEIIMINVWYLERIRKKWPSKTRSAKWN